MVENGPVIAEETLLNQDVSSVRCNHIYNVKMHRTSDDATLLPFFNRIPGIVNTIQFEKMNEEQTLFSMFSYYEGGPRNLIKFRRTFFDAIYGSAYPGLRKKFNMIDINFKNNI